MLWRPLAVGYPYRQQHVTGKAPLNKICSCSSQPVRDKQRLTKGMMLAVVKLKNLNCKKNNIKKTISEFCLISVKIFPVFKKIIICK